MDTAQNRTSIPDEAPQQARGRATYASFGDGGTTATATAYGHLLQITRYFGNKPSGFFCADLPSAPEPYYVESRMDYLQKSCQNASGGMRLLFDSEDSEKWRAQTNIGALPKMSFFQDRWPCFTTETPAFHLGIQYLISQSAVYQIYAFKLKEGQLVLPKIPKLAISANLLLRNLNFNEDDKENGRESYDKHYSRYITDDGHSIAIVHEVGQESKEPTESKEPKESKDIYAVGLFTSICINGRLQTIKAAEHPENYRALDGPKDLEDFEDFQIADDDTYYEITPDQRTADDFSELKTLKVTVAYKLAPATLADMGPVVIPESFLEAEQIFQSPFTKISFSEKEHLDFILRRNLEHILSVCSIPTNEVLEKDVLPAGSGSASNPAIALTCGDVSGHRIAATASLKDKDAMWINRATMGFRFDGDILDRYWTCHFIEYNPQKLVEPKTHEDDELHNLHSKMTERVVGALKGNAWRQRRILELVLFDLILEEMLGSTREILKEAQRCIERSFRPENLDNLDRQVSNSIFLDPLTMIDKVDNDNFFSTNTLWNELEPIFQLVKDALNENLATIRLWMEREKERRRDELQWTLNDERDYRGAISTLQVLNRHKVDRLERYSANIASFNASFARKLEAMRNDLDQRGADDIRLFTYVTVVFLPVGFATSIFSMSGAPAGNTLHQMIVTAIVALLVTFIALVNARILDRVLGPVFRVGRRVTESIVNPLISPMYKLVIQPISRAVYAFLWKVAYYITFHCYYQVYIQRFSPYYPKKRTQDTDAEDEEKNFKRLRESGPIRTAREKYMNIQKQREELKQEKKNMEQQVRKEKEEQYKKEEEQNFRANEQAKLNEKVLNEVTETLKKELDAAIKTRVEMFKKDEGDMNAERSKRLEDLLRQWLEPSIKERLIIEAKDKIRRETKLEIQKRVNDRIKEEVGERLDKKRKDEEEKRKEQEEEEEGRKRLVRDVKKARSGIVRRMIRKRSQTTQSRSAGAEVGDQV